MIKSAYLIVIIIILLALPGAVFGAQRFPPPQFSTGHELPTTTQPNPRADSYEYLDTIVLLAALCLASYLALKKRSRRGLFVLGILSLAYFGFWRKGCVCSIGAIQNVVLALFDRSYTVPVTVIIFFTLPLIFTLFFGRTFCASVCPLGAIQDLFLLKPVKVPHWLEQALRMFAYLYLGLAILFAATSSAFIICEYDPFVAFFRRSGNFSMLLLGACLLLVGIFIGRPYCRYLCPYSILLGWMSRASKWHLTITPDKCIQCRLCEDSCPFDSIQKPTQDQTRSRGEGKKRLAVLIGLLPIFIALGVLLGVWAGAPLSRVNATVGLAEQIWLEDSGQVKEITEPSDAFRRTGRPAEELYQEASDLNRKFVIGGGILGAFLGLVIGMKLIGLSVSRSRTDYEIDHSSCVSCGRCMPYCPVERSVNKAKNPEAGSESALTGSEIHDRD